MDNQEIKMTEDQIERTAKAVAYSVMKFYRNPENMKRFEEWLRHREQQETRE